MNMKPIEKNVEHLTTSDFQYLYHKLGIMEGEVCSILETYNFTCFPTILSLNRPTLAVKTNKKADVQLIVTLIPIINKDKTVLEFRGTLVYDFKSTLHLSTFKEFSSIDDLLCSLLYYNDLLEKN